MWSHTVLHTEYLPRTYKCSTNAFLLHRIQEKNVIRDVLRLYKELANSMFTSLLFPLHSKPASLITVSSSLHMRMCYVVRTEWFKLDTALCTTYLVILVDAGSSGVGSVTRNRQLRTLSAQQDIDLTPNGTSLRSGFSETNFRFYEWTGVEPTRVKWERLQFI